MHKSAAAPCTQCLACHTPIQSISVIQHPQRNAHEPMPTLNHPCFLHAASGGSDEDARRHAEQAAFDMVLLGHTLACESHEQLPRPRRQH